MCFTQRTRQSTAKDKAKKDPQASEAEVRPAVCPDSLDPANLLDTYSENPEGTVCRYSVERGKIIFCVYSVCNYTGALNM